MWRNIPSGPRWALWSPSRHDAWLIIGDGRDATSLGDHDKSAIANPYRASRVLRIWQLDTPAGRLAIIEHKST